MAWAGRWRATRWDSPGNLHLGMRIAVYLVALGIANRVCRSVVLEIQCLHLSRAGFFFWGAEKGVSFCMVHLVASGRMDIYCIVCIERGSG